MVCYLLVSIVERIGWQLVSVVLLWKSFQGFSLQDTLGNWGWMADPGVQVSCLEEPLGDKKLPPSSHFKATHNPHQVLNILMDF